MNPLLASVAESTGGDATPFLVILTSLGHSVTLGVILVIFTYLQTTYLGRFQSSSLFEDEAEGAKPPVETSPAALNSDAVQPSYAGSAPVQPSGSPGVVVNVTAAPAEPEGPVQPVAQNAEGERRPVGESTAHFLGAANILFLCVGLTGTMLLLNDNLVRAFAVVAAIALVRFRIKLDNKSLNATLLFGIIAGMACGLQEIALAWTMTCVYILLFSLVLGFAYLLNRAETRSREKLEKSRQAASPSPVPRSGDIPMNAPATPMTQASRLPS